MATAAEKRAWLVANGHPELDKGRGRLSDAHLAEWDAGHADYAPGAAEADFDLGFVEADDPPEDYPAPPPPAAADPEAVPEDRPGRPRPARGQPGRWSGWFLGRPKDRGHRAPRQRLVFDRVSVAPLIEDAYVDVAGAAGGIPPLQRLLYAQAPLAGVVLDPAVKDTVADRVLQPVARNYERSRILLAMLGTPMTLMSVLATAPQPVFEGGVMLWEQVVDQTGAVVLDENDNPVMRPKSTPVTARHQTSMVAFRYCVRAMADIGGDSLRRVQQRAAENAARDDLVDEFMAFILGLEVAAAPDEAPRQEGATAGLKLAGVAE